METIEIIKIVLAILLAIYEIIARLIPTSGRWSLIHKIIEFLKWISDKLDNAGERKLERQAKAAEREKIKLQKLEAKAINKIK